MDFHSIHLIFILFKLKNKMNADYISSQFNGSNNMFDWNNYLQQSIDDVYPRTFSGKGSDQDEFSLENHVIQETPISFRQGQYQSPITSALCSSSDSERAFDFSRNCFDLNKEEDNMDDISYVNQYQSSMIGQDTSPIGNQWDAVIVPFINTSGDSCGVPIPDSDSHETIRMDYLQSPFNSDVSFQNENCDSGDWENNKVNEVELYPYLQQSQGLFDRWCDTPVLHSLISTSVQGYPCSNLSSSLPISIQPKMNLNKNTTKSGYGSYSSNSTNPGRVSKSAHRFVSHDMGAHIDSNQGSNMVHKYISQTQLSMQCDSLRIEVENKHKWLSISPMTDSRMSYIIDKLKEKKVKLDTAYEVFDLFPQNYLNLKLEILSLEFDHYFVNFRSKEENDALQSKDTMKLNECIWLDQRKKRSSSQLKQFLRAIIKNGPVSDSVLVEARTSSGFNNFTESSTTDAELTDSDFYVLKLRHMNLLKESNDRKRKTKYYEFIEGKMKRPLNSFMLYRSSVMKALPILKLTLIITDLVSILTDKLKEADEYKVIDLILQTVKNRHGITMDHEVEPSIIKIISDLIESKLYRLDDASNPVPINPKFSNHTVLAHVITLMWNTETLDCREGFIQFSRLEKDHHHTVYPKYKYCPVKKVKSEESEDKHVQ